MKKRLLMAVLTGIMSFSCAQVNDVELLVHLQNFRKDMPVGDIRNCSEFELELIDEFYSKAEILQKMVTDEIARPQFEVICNNILPSREIVEKFGGNCPPQKPKIWIDVSFEPIDNRAKDKLFKLYIPIYKKLHRKWLRHFQRWAPVFRHMTGEDPTRYGCGVEVSDEGMRSHFERTMIVILYGPECLGKNWPLLKLIDAKIAELEAQVS